MKRLIIPIFLAIAASAAWLPGSVLAADAKLKEVKLAGALICLGCDAKMNYGANAQCSVYGHQHALKTSDGKIYTFLPNDKSRDLIKGGDSHDAKVTVTGVVLPRTQVIDVKSVTGFKASSASAEPVYKCSMCGKTADKPGQCCGLPMKEVKS